MGRYVAGGLAVRIRVRGRRGYDVIDNMNRILKAMSKVIDLGLYTVEESEEDFTLNLKEDIVNAHIEDFLKEAEFYCFDHNILKEDIDEMVIVNIDDEIFALTDAVINGDISNSMRLYNFFINHNYEQVQIIALLGSQFHFLFQVKRLYNQVKYKDDIAKILEVHPYRVKLALGKIYSYSEELLLSYISKLADMDKNIKLGKIDKGLALELFLINKDM